MVRFLYFFGIYLGLDPTFPAKKSINPICKSLGRGTLSTCKFSGSISQKRGGHFDFSAVKCKNHGGWHRLVLLYTWYSILGVKCALIFVLHIQSFEYLSETLYKHGWEHLEAARSGKIAFFFPSYGKRLINIDLFEGL